MHFVQGFEVCQLYIIGTKNYCMMKRNIVFGILFCCMQLLHAEKNLDALYDWQDFYINTGYGYALTVDDPILPMILMNGTAD